MSECNSTVLSDQEKKLNNMDSLITNESITTDSEKIELSEVEDKMEESNNAKDLDRERKSPESEIENRVIDEVLLHKDIEGKTTEDSEMAKTVEQNVGVEDSQSKGEENQDSIIDQIHLDKENDDTTQTVNCETDKSGTDVPINEKIPDVEENEVAAIEVEKDVEEKGIAENQETKYEAAVNEDQANKTTVAEEKAEETLQGNAVIDEKEEMLQDKVKESSDDNTQSTMEDYGKESIDDNAQSTMEDYGKESIDDNAQSKNEDNGKELLDDDTQSKKEDDSKESLDNNTQSKNDLPADSDEQVGKSTEKRANPIMETEDAKEDTAELEQSFTEKSAGSQKEKSDIESSADHGITDSGEAATKESEDINESVKLIEDEEMPDGEVTSTEKMDADTVDLDKSDEVAIIGEETTAAKNNDSSKKSTSKESSKESKSKTPQKCIVCEKVGKCKYNIVRNGDIKHLCDDKCFKIFRANPTSYLKGKADSDKTNGMPGNGSLCEFCQNSLPVDEAVQFSLKYNQEEKKFCSNDCRFNFKRKEKLCASCDKNLKVVGTAIVAPVNGKILDFCTLGCQTKYEKSTSKDDDEDDVEIVGTSKTTKPASVISKCSVCGKSSLIKHEVLFKNVNHKLCSEPCYAAFCYANKLAMVNCDSCKKMCPGENNSFTLQFIGAQKKFCSTLCMSTFKTKNDKELPCTWCQTKKSNFDMVERIDNSNKTQLFCSLNCLSLYRVNLQATSNQSVTCDQCHKFAPAQYHLTMSDASVRNFCSYNCVMAFQGQFQSPQSGRNQAGSKSANSSGNNRSNSRAKTGSRSSSRVASKTAAASAIPGPNQPIQNQNMPLISQVVSLQSEAGTLGRAASNTQATKTITKTVKEITTQTKVMVQPPPSKTTKNKSMLCKPFTQTKATSCRPHAQSKECQTEDDLITKPYIIPVPIPIYVPVPMAMYNIPVPYPVPLPVPIPIPCFIPTTKKSANGILKQINKIQSSMPSDPFEAELLGMAAALAGEDGDDSSSSDEDNEEYNALPGPTPIANQTVDTNADMLQMAMRMTMPQNIMDMENNIAPTPVNPENAPMPTFSSPIDQMAAIVPAESNRGRGRGKRRGSSRRSSQTKKVKIEQQQQPAPEPIQPVAPPQPPPDEHMVLKFTYGVNAWKHWVMQKNEQIQKAATRSRGRLKLYKPDLLQCTPDELNYSLCQFVNEVRKPNGEEYAPDSIYYLCLGIQEYLYENGRVDNIFTDVYYDRFTECLDDVIKKYEVRLNAQGLIVCRIEEEHLWESKQLGAHSPFVLLNTLIYFNARFFMLRTPEEHLKLSFSHIMKHWKKTNMPGSRQPGRSVYLRYYAPVHQAEAGNKRRREDLPVFEQGENIENPLRCPVKLYEFYLSKCPESIKNRNDVFYLMPERSCVPDSPVWYSTGSLPIEIMTRMLNRIRVIKEIQEAHLAYQPMGYNTMG